jgi:hypothetical protein
MNETARALLVAAILSGTGLGWLIGELRLTHWMALVIAATAGAWLGLAAAAGANRLAGLDVTISVAYIVFAAWVMQRETRAGLVALSIAFVAHALIDVAHRPGWLSPDLAPGWFVVGGAAYDVYLAALCFWVQRR